MKRLIWKIALVLAAIGGTAAWAAEVISFRYDARGRLIRVEHGDGPNKNVTVNYSHDKADNRTNRTVTGAP